MRTIRTWLLVVATALLVLTAAYLPFGRLMAKDPNKPTAALASRAPVAMDDYYETDVNTPFVIQHPGFLENDDWGEGYTWAHSGDFFQHGDFQIFSGESGYLSYTPDTDYEGTDYMEYVVFNEISTSSEVATIYITVGGSKSKQKPAKSTQRPSSR